MGIELRPYQATFTADIAAAFRQGYRRVCGTMATGSGKGTVAAAMVARAVERGHRVYVLAHRTELVEDLSDRIGRHGIRHGLIAANRSMDLSCAVQVASVDTIVRRLHKLPAPSLIIQDEAHHLIAGNKWGKVISAWPGAYLVGLTATPQRLSGEGLGDGYGGFFQHLILGPSAAWLTEQGFLSRARVLAPPGVDLSKIRSFDTITGKARASEMLSRGQAMGDAIGHYRREIAPIHAGTVVGFCVSVSHAEAMAAAYRDAGIAAASLDGKTDRVIRRQLLRDLGNGALKALFSCEIISEGTDIPSVTGAQLLRPTDSLTLYLQQVGRALRVSPGKPHAVILDHVGNSHRHGLPTDPREWSLEGKVGGKAGERPPSVKVCSRCFCAMPSGKSVCPECGHIFTSQPREIVNVPGQLKEIQARQQRRAEQSSARTLADLIAYGEARGMQRPHAWARHVLAAREAKRERSGRARRGA